MSQTLAELQQMLLEVALMEQGVFEGKEDLHSPVPSQEKDFALPTKYDHSHGHRADLHDEPRHPAEVACRLINQTATDALNQYLDDKEGSVVPDYIVKALSAIADLAWNASDVGSGTGESVTDSPGEPAADNGEGGPNDAEAKEEAYAGFVKYHNSTEYTKGWDDSLKWAAAIEEAARTSDGALDPQGSSPAVHPGPVAREAPGE
jgi:hypothetical protein